jgi:hypothetical protein
MFHEIAFKKYADQGLSNNAPISFQIFVFILLFLFF